MKNNVIKPIIALVALITFSHASDSVQKDGELPPQSKKNLKYIPRHEFKILGVDEVRGLAFGEEKKEPTQFIDRLKIVFNSFLQKK